MLILVFLWVLCEISAKSLDTITLPDGRNIPDPDSYKYFEERTNKSIVREYILLETKPSTAIMCPMNYSIGEISQVLLLKENISDQMSKTPFQAAPQTAAVGQIKIPEAACPRLFKCLAYQACFFKFGNEFCGRDAAPAIRKFLQVNVTCIRDGSIPRGEHHRDDLVLYMTYKSRVEEGVRDYSGTIVKYVEILEEEVFHTHCPPLRKALDQGYGGSCTVQPSLYAKEQLWSILGRTSSKKCREELTQVFCAFQYNSQGLCIPPIFLEKNKKMTYNFRSLPEVGSRPVPDIFYKQFMNAHHSSLVPAKLAFLLLLHKDVLAAIDLLELIYRPYNWYVIHVDSRAHAVRQELYHALKQVYRGARNIIVLPEERSFPTSWGSYDIVRAELEGFEELLRQGIWDFAINLSGADYPLRDVDDLAAALAPHKGLNFFPFVHWRKVNESMDDSNLLKKTFHACDGYVYNIKATHELPKPDDLKIYNSPQWGAFSRNFITYLVNGTARSENLTKFQFYLQTRVVPDESYIPTLLMNSKFKSTVRTGFIHTSKEFASDNINNLCRHSNDADFCGQGPPTYDLSDISDILSASHGSFFARKFLTDLTDKTRGVVRELSQSGYYKFFDTYLPQEILKTLAMNAMAVMYNKTSTLKFGRILHLRVLPSLLPHNPCCQSVFISRLRKMIDYVLWLDFTFINTGNGEVKDARVVLEPSLNSRFCYFDGHLKMAFVTTWFRDVLQNLKKEHPVRISLDQTLPLPYGPAYVSEISIILFFSRDVEDIPKCSDEGSFGIPITFSNSGTESLHPILVSLQLMAPDQRIKCARTERILWNIKNEEEQESTHMIHPIRINCGVMQPGPWQILISEVNAANGHIYNFPFYLLDYFNKENLKHQLLDVTHLWKIKEASPLFNDKPNTESSSGMLPHIPKVFFHHRSYVLHPHKQTFTKFIQPPSTTHTSIIVGVEKISKKTSTSTCMLLWILGTAATFVSCVLIIIRTSMIHHCVVLGLLLFTSTTVIQIILSSSFC